MAIAFLMQALENHYQVCKKKDEETNAEKSVEIDLLTSLGNVHKQESDLEALQCFQRSLEIQSAIPDDKSVVITLYNLGNTYCLKWSSPLINRFFIIFAKFFFSFY